MGYELSESGWPAGGRGSGTEFPHEFDGLLPSREDPMSPTSPPNTVQEATGEVSAPDVTAHETALESPDIFHSAKAHPDETNPFPSTEPQVVAQPKAAAGDDFDSSFDDLAVKIGETERSLWRHANHHAGVSVEPDLDLQC